MAKNYKRWLCEESLNKGLENPLPNVQFCYIFEFRGKLSLIPLFTFFFLSAKFANFGEPFANFLFRRKFGEISAHLLFWLVPAKFWKLGDEPKRKFAASWISLRNLEKASRIFASLTKFRFVLNDISVTRSETKFRYWKVLNWPGRGCLKQD